MLDDFDDTLDDLIGSEARKIAPRKPVTFTPALERPEYSEGCPRCHGTGRWHGRGTCFACKGAGRRTFKTSPESRAKARAKGAEKRVEREADKELWRHQHSAEIAWATRAAARNAERGGTFDWPQKLLDGLAQYGTWTDGQLSKVQELMARDWRNR
jgi:RecJ-like exonuclease